MTHEEYAIEAGFVADSDGFTLAEDGYTVRVFFHPYDGSGRGRYDRPWLVRVGLVYLSGQPKPDPRATAGVESILRRKNFTAAIDTGLNRMDEIRNRATLLRLHDALPEGDWQREFLAEQLGMNR